MTLPTQPGPPRCRAACTPGPQRIGSSLMQCYLAPDGGSVHTAAALTSARRGQLHDNPGHQLNT